MSIMAANYIQQNLNELRKNIQDNAVRDNEGEYIDLDDEYMFEQLEDDEEDEQHF